MRNFSYKEVELVSGYLKNKQELNETVTINAVYDRFEETGRIKAFNCDWKEGDDKSPIISGTAMWPNGWREPHISWPGAGMMNWKGAWKAL